MFLLESRKCISFVISSVIFVIVFLLNLFLLTAGSSGAVPFGGCFGNNLFESHYLFFRYHAAYYPALVWHFCATVCHWVIFWFKAWGMLILQFSCKTVVKFPYRLYVTPYAFTKSLAKFPLDLNTSNHG